jgi:hypothetical protein
VSSSFVLTLDTTGPVVEWGTPTGAVATETLQLPYTTDEPLARGVLHAGGRDFELTVAPDVLSVLLPADVENGLADVSVYDDVGNQARSTGVVTITGGVVGPPIILGGGGPSRRAEPKRKRVVEHKQISSVSKFAVDSHSSIRIVVSPASVSEAFTFSSSRVSAVVPTVSTIRIRALPTASRCRVESMSPASSQVIHSDVVHRRDGPNMEALIFLLD